MTPVARCRQAVLDLIAVLLFVVIGRSAHEHGVSPSGVVSTAWPFLTGLAVAWLVVGLRGRNGASLASGLWLALCTVALGMFLRVISGQGTAVAFVFVAIGFLLAAMWSWRIVLAVARARST